MKRMERQGRSSLSIWFGWAALIGLCPIIPMLPYAFGLAEWGLIRYGVYVYLGLVALMLAVTPLLFKRALQANEAVYLAPLGLTQTELPEVGFIPGAAAPRKNM
jgi:hypothetical protein